ncbi:MAG: DUF2283 domain-containing protein [Caldilineaceae bacterium]
MNKQTTGIFELRLSDNRHEIAYLRLPTYPKERQLRVSKSIRLVELLGKYEGPDIVFDFDLDDILVGIEVITDNFDDESKLDQE